MGDPVAVEVPAVEDLALEPTAAAAAAAALAELAVFRGCGPALLGALVGRARRQEILADETLEALGSPHLVVVEHGALRLQVGAGPAVVRGQGLVLNFAGLLGLQDPQPAPERPEAPPSPGGGPGGGSPYRVHGFQGPPADPLQDRLSSAALRRPTPGGGGQDVLTDDQLCFYSLCPAAAAGGGGPALSLTASGAKAEEMPEDPGGSRPTSRITRPRPERSRLRSFEPMTTRLLLIPADAVADLEAQGAGDLDLERFRANCGELGRSCRALARWFAPVLLPGAPLEVVWAIAEVSERIALEAGGTIVTEGDMGQACDDVFVLERGEACVEKLISVGGAPKSMELGRLRAGALVGDLLLQSGGGPRAASARALRSCVVLRVPRVGLLDVLARFPGALDGAEARLLEGARLVGERLPTRTEVVHSLNLFEECALRFVADLGGTAERKSFLGGRAVVEQGGPERALWALEQGRCSVEKLGTRLPGELSAGACFGERALLGLAHVAELTVRASSPVALLLSLPRAGLNACLEQHMEERPHIDALRRALGRPRTSGPAAAGSAADLQQEHGARRRRLRAVELFSPCGSQFLQALEAELETPLFMPAQSITLEGSRDADARMFLLMGGMVVAESSGRHVARMMPGATFGELAMLGVTQRRCTSVRAVTFALALALRRSAFFRALQQHPLEEQHFNEVLAASQQDFVVWPCLQDVAPAVLQALDMQSETRKLAAQDDALSSAPASECAVLVLGGEVSVRDSRGREVDVLFKGGCFNEQVLHGEARRAEVVLVPRTSCDVRLLSPWAWDKVMEDFSDEEWRARAALLRYRGDAAEKRLGHEPGSGSFLREAVGFLRNASDGLLAAVRDCLETRVVRPGEVICGTPAERHNDLAGDSRVTSKRSQPGGGHEPHSPHPTLAERTLSARDPESCLCLLLDGIAMWEDDLNTHPVQPGTALGEAAVLGIERRQLGTLRAAPDAAEPCVVRLLPRAVLQEVLQGFPRDNECVTQLVSEITHLDNQVVDRKMLFSRLMGATTFVRMDPAFVQALCHGVKIKVYPASTQLLRQGEACLLGQTGFFLVLGGKVNLLSEHGTVFRTAHAGELLGELGAFGLMSSRTAGAAVWQDGLACCAYFSGVALAAAMKEHPHGFSGIMDAVSALNAVNSNIEQDRRSWIHDVACPALRSASLLTGCPADFLEAIASTLTERSFQPGTMISAQGEITREMIVILEGSAEVVGRAGKQLGTLRAGATFGDVSVLGLFPASMATVRSRSASRVLTLPEAELRRALGARGREVLLRRFQRLVEDRYDQVSLGLPISALGLDAPSTCVGVRTIALLSEKVVLEPGEAVKPVRDSDPRGPILGLLARGRLLLDMAPGGDVVSSFPAGSVVPEGLAAEFGARLTAETPSEYYRIKRVDFAMAVDTGLTEQWLWRFRLQERGAAERLRARLQNARGRAEAGSRAPHPKSKDLQEWRAQRGLQLRERAQVAADPGRLPAVASLRAGADALAHKMTPSSSDGFLPPAAGAASTPPAAGPTRRRKRSPRAVVPNGALSAYPILRLTPLPQLAQRPPKGDAVMVGMQSMPNLRKAEGGRLGHL